MFVNFSEETRHLLKQAEQEKEKLNHPYVGSEHLLLSILKDSKLVPILKKYGVTYKRFKEKLVSLVGVGSKKSDFNESGFGKLAVMEFQKDLERTAWLQGGMSQVAPAQRMADFVNRKLSAEVNVSSYTPGLVASPLHFWLPDFVAGRLSQAFVRFGKTSKGFLTNEANLIGVETRTSSPVRILRDADTLQHVSLPGLFPCGEGAGYAGGIVSAAIDGERCAEMLADYIQKIR